MSDIVPKLEASNVLRFKPYPALRLVLRSTKVGALVHSVGCEMNLLPTQAFVFGKG
jgi:hypothetical protein